MTDTSPMELSPTPAVSDEPYISLTIHSDMHLIIAPTEVAREGEHNSALFKIVKQPSSLDSYVCRAKIQTSEGKTYRLVIAKEFRLTNDISVVGPGRLQLVYSDGDVILRKTDIATFHVTSSVNAIDPSDPEFSDGLAQIQRAAFASVVGADTLATFYNIDGQPVAVLLYPPGQGGGLDEAQANLLYVRQDGTSLMSGDLRMVSSQGIDAPIGVVVGGRLAELRWDGALILRRGQANEPVVIENNNGTARSEILTQLTGDLRYLTPDGANLVYARRDGTQMTGPLISQNGSSNTNLGLSVGENSTGFWRTALYLICSIGGQTAWQTSGTEMMIGLRLNMATNQITNVGAPTAAGDAVNRLYVDGLPRPNSRTYLTNSLDLTTTAQILSDNPFPVANNNQKTITVTVFPSFSGGTPSAFYDLIFACSIAPLIEARTTVYPTSGAYMFSPVRFAATVTPSGGLIQVQITARLAAAGPPGTLTITGSAADKRSYCTIEEQQN